jgi:antitoxin component of RelBE/YafQ-DinJ toxin-antitoxin module
MIYRMDAKITLSFDKKIIERAKQYAETQNISLSRLMEFLLDKITSEKYNSIENFPVSDWVNAVAEGSATYITKPQKRAKLKSEYMNRKK